MVIFILMGALVLVALFVGVFVVRGNSPAGRGKSGESADAGRSQARQGSSARRGTGEN